MDKYVAVIIRMQTIDCKECDVSAFHISGVDVYVINTHISANLGERGIVLQYVFVETHFIQVVRNTRHLLNNRRNIEHNNRAAKFFCPGNQGRYILAEVIDGDSLSFLVCVIRGIIGTKCEHEQCFITADILNADLSFAAESPNSCISRFTANAKIEHEEVFARRSSHIELVRITFQTIRPPAAAIVVIPVRNTVTEQEDLHTTSPPLCRKRLLRRVLLRLLLASPLARRDFLRTQICTHQECLVVIGSALIDDFIGGGKAELFL